MRLKALMALALLLAACSSDSTETPGSSIRMPDGVREHAYVMDIETGDDGAVSLTVDPAQFLTGEEAKQAAIEDGFISEGDTVPGDYYIVNESSDLRELAMDPDAPVVLNVCLEDEVCDVQVEVSVDLWIDMMEGAVPDGRVDGFKWYVGGNLPYALILDDDTIVGIEEQYLP